MRMSELHAEKANQGYVVEYITVPEKVNLRDQIAIAALQSLLLRDDWKNIPVFNICKAAYVHADEMLAAREDK